MPLNIYETRTLQACQEENAITCRNWKQSNKKTKYQFIFNLKLFIILLCNPSLYLYLYATIERSIRDRMPVRVHTSIIMQTNIELERIEIVKSQLTAPWTMVHHFVWLFLPNCIRCVVHCIASTRNEKLLMHKCHATLTDHVKH